MLLIIVSTGVTRTASWFVAVNLSRGRSFFDLTFGVQLFPHFVADSVCVGNADVNRVGHESGQRRLPCRSPAKPLEVQRVALR